MIRGMVRYSATLLPAGVQGVPNAAISLTRIHKPALTLSLSLSLSLSLTHTHTHTHTRWRAGERRRGRERLTITRQSIPCFFVWWSRFRGVSTDRKVWWAVVRAYLNVATIPFAGLRAKLTCVGKSSDVTGSLCVAEQGARILWMLPAVSLPRIISVKSLGMYRAAIRVACH